LSEAKKIPLQRSYANPFRVGVILTSDLVKEYAYRIPGFAKKNPSHQSDMGLIYPLPVPQSILLENLAKKKWSLVRDPIFINKMI